MDIPNCETIAGRLSQARQQRGLTRNKVRNALGYSFDTYVAVEVGERLPMGVELPAIALWLSEGDCGQFHSILEVLRHQLAVEREQRAASSDASSIAPSPAAAVHATDDSASVPA